MGGTGLVIAQLPTDALPEWSRLGFSGACLAVALILATKTIPSILSAHRHSQEKLRESMDKGFDEVKQSIEKGDDRVATLLQSTLTQLITERREQRNGK